MVSLQPGEGDERPGWKLEVSASSEVGKPANSSIVRPLLEQRVELFMLQPPPSQRPPHRRRRARAIQPRARLLFPPLGPVLAPRRAPRMERLLQKKFIAV